MPRFTIALYVGCLAIAAVPAAMASTILGTLRDAYGPVANATVQARHVKTNKVYETNSDESGYTLTDIPAGSYQIVVLPMGRRTERFVANDVRVGLVQTRVFDIELKNGDLGTTGGDVAPPAVRNEQSLHDEDTRAAPQTPSATKAEGSPATLALEERSTLLQRDMVKLGERVYVATGYSPANISMVVGDTGVIIVDTGMAPPHAAAALADFRKVSSLPVAAIVYTHGHGDHTGGAAVFAEGAQPQIWARSNFGSEDQAFTSAGLTVQNLRGARQGGFQLPADQRINNGVALAFAPPPQGGAVFAGNRALAPTHTFVEPRKSLQIAGVKLELVAAPGETADALYVWLPDDKVLFSGDNFYASWPNLYAIRGTPYRDVRAWADANDMMLKEGAEVLVPGHTRPVLGKEQVAEALSSYRDAIRFVFDKTVEGMNKGLTPDELVDYVRVPSELADKDYLREFYGNREWAVRAIFDGYLGWFDGNPTHLFSLSPKDEAQRLAALAGGRDALLANARAALAAGDAQWAAQLADSLIALNPDASEPLLLKADALTRLADGLLTATGRNYYLAVALELRARARQIASSR